MSTLALVEWGGWRRGGLLRDNLPSTTFRALTTRYHERPQVCIVGRFGNPARNGGVATGPDAVLGLHIVSIHAVQFIWVAQTEDRLEDWPPGVVELGFSLPFLPLDVGLQNFEEACTRSYARAVRRPAVSDQSELIMDEEEAEQAAAPAAIFMNGNDQGAAKDDSVSGCPSSAMDLAG
ncbi:hypothetical protein HPB52_022933 [Rhipicephalus sanguineus]|uniref:Uncharacterized protein n=1 Tax=Rhipicephalus sanguineus TaxID=34632 RepID=A0A9D4T0X6_RHISA|nr:hypothetical protein HPB52_022933 [Rhipicephalus sanguineus]